jgi:hypothetical protein
MSQINGDLPAYVNDDGTGRTGTRVNVVFLDAWRDAINTQTYSAANPTLTPADIIDEVVTARGSTLSLDDRLDAEHNEDGTHNLTGSLGTVVTSSQLMGGLGGVNLIRNDDFLVWPDGDSSAPLWWTLTGAAATVARTGTGLGDTTRKVGDFACKVTRAGTDCYIGNSLLSGGAFTRANFLKQKYLAFGMWVYCSTPNIARIGIYDGVGITYSDYHTGGGTFEYLPVTRQIDSSATELTVRGRVDTSDGSAVFSGATALLHNGPVGLELVQYQPSPVLYGTMHFALSGNLTVAANQGRVRFRRGGIVKDLQILAKTAPTGQPAIFDLNTWDGANYTTMFSTKPEVAAAAFAGGGQPDGTYARRCLRGSFGATRSAGSEMTLDVDQIGSGTAGADAVVEVGVLQYASPLERFLGYSD